MVSIYDKNGNEIFPAQGSGRSRYYLFDGWRIYPRCELASLDPVDRKAKITFRVSKSGNDPLTGKPYSKLKAVNELFGNGLGFCTKELWELQFPSFLTVQLEKKSNQTLAVTNPIRYKSHVYRRVSGRFKDFKSEIVLPRSPCEGSGSRLRCDRVAVNNGTLDADDVRGEFDKLYGVRCLEEEGYYLSSCSLASSKRIGKIQLPGGYCLTNGLNTSLFNLTSQAFVLTAVCARIDIN